MQERTRTKKVLSIEKVMNKMLENLNLTKRIKENQAINIWPSVVGSEISKVTKPLYIKQSILYIKVKNDVWRNEIIYQKKNIMDKINDELSGKFVREIKFI